MDAKELITAPSCVNCEKAESYASYSVKCSIDGEYEPTDNCCNLHSSINCQSKLSLPSKNEIIKSFKEYFHIRIPFNDFNAENKLIIYWVESLLKSHLSGEQGKEKSSVQPPSVVGKLKGNPECCTNKLPCDNQFCGIEKCNYDIHVINDEK